MGGRIEQVGERRGDGDAEVVEGRKRGIFPGGEPPGRKKDWSTFLMGAKVSGRGRGVAGGGWR